MPRPIPKALGILSLVPLLTMVAVGCTTAPTKTSVEHQESLLKLIHDGDERRIRDYVEQYSSCLQPDPAVGCLGRERGLVLNRQIVTADEIIGRMEAATNEIQWRVKACGADLSCLANVGVGGGIMCPRTGAGCVLEAHTLADGRKLMTVRRADEAGAGLWITDQSRRTFLSAFMPLAEVASRDNTPLIVAEEQRQNSEQKGAAEKKTLDEKEKMHAGEEWKKRGCIQLANFIVRQRTSERQYLIYTPCFGRNAKSGHCNLFSGLMFTTTVPALLKTTSIVFEGSGESSAIIVKKSGERTIPMDDGFNQWVPVFQEDKGCSDLLEKARN